MHQTLRSSVLQQDPSLHLVDAPPGSTSETCANTKLHLEKASLYFHMCYGSVVLGRDK